MSGSVIDIVSPVDDLASAPADSALVPQTTKYFLAEWLARFVIVAVAAGLAWYTWAHWGDFQIDSGREFYVPAALSKGQLLFRDIRYQYGPLPPYTLALLFHIFGVHLTVLYAFGLALTIGTALVMFETAKEFKLSIVASAVPSLFFLSEAFYPFIRNFVFPYSYAASLGAFLGLACLYFILRYASSMRMFHIGAAAALAGLACLTKQEFGLSCVLLLVFAMAAAYGGRRSQSELLRNTLLCLAGLAPAIAVCGWFISKVSVRAFFMENWISTPGSYFMRSVAKTFMADQGFRFVPSEVLELAEYAALAFAIWYLLAFLNAALIGQFNLRSRLAIGVTLMIAMLPLAITCLVFIKHAPWGMVVNPLAFSRSFWQSGATRLLFNSLTQAIFPTGMFLLVLIYPFTLIWTFWREDANAFPIKGIALFIYAVFIGFRQMMELEPTLYKCAVFFNLPAFLIFIILVDHVIRWAGRSLDVSRREFLVGGMLAAEAVFLFALFFPRPRILPAPVTTEYGTFYTKHDIAVLFPQIVSFMKTHTNNRKDILVIPEPPSLYLFAGMQAPSRWLQLTPGLIPPEEEASYINEMKSNEVRYVLIIKRSLNEYGVPGFLQDGYNHEIYRWILANFTPAGQFGPLTQNSDSSQAFTMSVYARKDIGAVQSRN
jgi:hypothetical protein